MAFIVRKINLETLVITLIFFLNTSWWFFDRTIVPTVTLSILKMLIPLLALIVINPRIKRMPDVCWLFLISLAIYYVAGNLSGIYNNDLPLISKIVPTGLTFFLNIFVLFSVQERSLYQGYRLYFGFFIAIVSISFIEYVLLVSGLERDYQLYNLNFRELEYRRYWLLIVCDWLVYPFSDLNLTRFNGPFEEPGNVGTYGGILIWINWLLTKKHNIANSILYFFSFSFAYFYSLLVYYLFAIKLKTKALVAIIIVGLSVFIFPLLKYFIISRYTSGGILGDSRGQFIDKWELYADSQGLFDFVVGHGFGSNMLMPQAQFASYHRFIVETGYIGFFFLCLAMLILLLGTKDALTRVFGLVLVGLIWQRPEFSSGPYLAAYSLIFCTKRLG